MIEIHALTQHFDSPSGRVEAIRDVSISIRKGDIFGIAGHSGAGKSSLVRALNLLSRPTAGRIILDGRDMTSLDAAALRKARRHIGMVFQHFNLLSSRTVHGNIALPLELAGASKAETDRKVHRLLDMVGLAAFADRYPAQIGNEQQQRAGIARALANDPKVLLADEATSLLDPEAAKSILELLRKINRETGLTIVLATPRMEEVKMICDRMAVMDAGQVIKQGHVSEVLQAPWYPATRALIEPSPPPGLPAGLTSDQKTGQAKASTHSRGASPKELHHVIAVD